MMAANDSSPVTFYDTFRNAFYFDVSETVLDGDCFVDSQRSITYNLRCKDNNILFLNNAEQFRLQHQQEHCQHDCKFSIHIYQDVTEDIRPGVPVMLYANKNGKKLVACCSENNEIYPEAMVLPNTIVDTAHKALFYLTMLTADKFMFESTLYRSNFLGFTLVEGNPTLKKLVLRKRGLDGFDDSAEATLYKCSA